MAPLFVSSALTSGIALVIVVVLALERVRRTSVGGEARRWLGGFLAVSILLNFFVLIAEYITIASARVPGDSAALSQLAFGSYAWIFWSEIGTGIVALALVITPRGRASRWLIVAASSLILVNVALERMQLIVGGLRFPNLGYAPGISLGTPSQLNTIGVPTASSFAQAARYTPSWVEWSIVIGLCALWGLLLLAGIRYLPLGSRTELTSPATPSMPAAAMAPAPSRVRPSIERAVSVTAPIDLVGSRRVGASHGRPR